MAEQQKMDDQHTATISSDLAKRIQEELGQNVFLCYQCVKCTSGCPLAEFFDWQPNQIMRAVQLGQEDIALHAQTPWLCASCQTCTTRCPQGLDIAGIMEFLTREASDRGIPTPVPEVDDFNQAFLREVRIWGRAYEPGMMAEIKLRNLDHLFRDMDLYTRMLHKRKVAMFPNPVRFTGKRKTTTIPDVDTAVAYYPGCSLESTAPEFNLSSKAVCEALGVRLVEPRGWLCCGSSPAHRSDPQAAIQLPLENLSLMEQSGFKEVTMPCAACFNRHKTALYEIRHDPSLLAKAEKTFGISYQDTVQVSSLVETIYQHVGPDGVREKVQKPLTGLRVVCYYGCLLTRPPEVTEAEHHENPQDMDKLMRALGAEVLDWSYKTSCCGASHAISRPDIVLRLSRNLIEQARKVGADVIAVACPLCHANLDARQFQMKLDEPLPVLYFTQLMALALDLPEKAAALSKNLVDPLPLLQERGLVA